MRSNDWRSHIGLVLIVTFAAGLAAPVAAQQNNRKPAPVTAGPKPSWIWPTKDGGEGQTAVFRKAFTLSAKPGRAVLTATCDNYMVVFVNDQKVAESDTWESPVTVVVTDHLKAGENHIRVQARNDGSIAGLVLALEATIGQQKQYVVTDDSWQTAATADGPWAKPHVHGQLGVGPWGNIFASPRPSGGGGGGTATPADAINVPKGFKIELIHDVPKGEQGSWVALTVDDKGRLIASDQENKGLFRITVGPDGKADVQKINVPVSGAHGMVVAFGALYANVNGGPGSGLYRITDTDNDDQYDKVEKLFALNGGGEHGPHAVIVTEDGKDLYIIGGNHTQVPPDLTGSRHPTNWGEDLLLPRQWDARGHARGILAPGGWIARVSPDGRQRAVVSHGYRNQYDIAINRDGEMFTFDSDMEWDLGAPWYRPTRVYHATSGSEFGWRSGTGKWPVYYPDNLPPVVDIGPASPTGVVFGYGAKFPGKWERALYILDWTYGTIWAVHLTPDGASYRGTVEEFVSGAPLPVTDAIVGKDGAFYFAIGGRNTQSGLYRVTYTGVVEQEKLPADPVAARARELRRSLESFHGRHDPKAIDAAWPHLSHADRFIRYAARIAVESQSASQWQSRALAETDTTAALEAMLALARQGDKTLLPQAVAALNRIDYSPLPVDQKLALLRIYGVTFIRMGKPDAALGQSVIAKLDPHYPADDDRLNAELCNLLVYLDSPTVVEKTLKLMANPKPTPRPNWATVLDRNQGYGGTVNKMLENMPPLQNIHYAFALRNVRYGWTLEQRQQYFRFFPQAAKHAGGASYEGFLENIRKEALANCSDAEREALASITGEKINPAPKLTDLPKPKGPGKAYTVDELTTLVGRGLTKRDFENGRKMYAAALCITCHRFDGAGGANGPDLTALASRFQPRDILESIIEPSKVISDQYESSLITLKGGDAVIGRIIAEDDHAYQVAVNPVAPDQIQTIEKAKVESVKPSPISFMPAGLINSLNQEEVLDLMAYLLSRGDKNAAVFR